MVRALNLLRRIVIACVAIPFILGAIVIGLLRMGFELALIFCGGMLFVLFVEDRNK